MYYKMRGFIYSVCLAVIYLLLILFFTSESTIIIQALERVVLFIGIAGVVTFLSIERKRWEEKLQKSENRYKTVADFTYDWEYWLDPQYRFIYCSPSCESITGYNAEEFLADPDLLDRLIHPDHQPGFAIHKKDACKAGHADEIEFLIIRSDGTERWIGHTCQAVYDENSVFMGIRGSNRDITKRKQAEKELLFRNVFLTTQQEASIDGMLVVDENARILSYNRRFVELWGLPAKLVEEKIDEPVLQFVTNQMADPRSFLQRVQYLYEHQQETSRDELVLADGRCFDRYSAPMIGPDKRYFGRIWYFHDITELKQAEDALRINEGRYRMAEAIGHVGNWEYNLHATKFWGSDEAKRIYGFDTEALDFSTDEVENCIPERERVHQALVDLIEADKPYNLEFEIHPKNSSEPRIISSIAELKRDEHGNPLIVTGFIQDITELKQAEEALHESEEKYRSIFDNAKEGIFQTTPEGRFITVNPAMVHMHGFASPEEMITDIVCIGKQIFVNSEDRGRYRTILEEKGEVNNFEAQVYRKDGSNMWISINAHEVKGADGNISHFEGTSEDITSRKLAEEELKQTLGRLRKSLIGTIQALSSTVETRDPCTAGHQKNVSNLACSIAQEMALSKDTIDTIRMAGIIHDIGKVSVPADILSRPGKISDIEMSLIKVHSQSGYDIIKDVGLPYPIAEIVLQHHERLDGSGYPQGLKDNNILLETRIIAVADVVEAMVSHRPYRPAKGIDAALEEIEKNKGILYDEKVVEACLRLFREKGFVFEPTES